MYLLDGKTLMHNGVITAEALTRNCFFRSDPSTESRNTQLGEWSYCPRSAPLVLSSGGSAGSALGQSEAAFYILDTVPLLLNVAIFVMIWPPICLSEDGPADTPLSGVARREG